jgi:hypothetical protein
MVVVVVDDILKSVPDIAENVTEPVGGLRN